MFRRHMRPVATDPDAVNVGGVIVMEVAAAAAVPAYLMVNRVREVLPMVIMTLRSISQTTLTSAGTLIPSIRK